MVAVLYIRSLRIHRVTHYSEEPLATSNFVRIAEKGGQSRRECSSLELLRRGVSRHRCPYVTHPTAAATESVLFKSGVKRAFCHILAQPIFQSPECMGRPAAAAPC